MITYRLGDGGDEECNQIKGVQILRVGILAKTGLLKTPSPKDRAYWKGLRIWSRRESLAIPLLNCVLISFANVSQTKSVIQN